VAVGRSGGRDGLVRRDDAPHRLLVDLRLNAGRDLLVQLLDRQLRQLHGRAKDLVGKLLVARLHKVVDERRGHAARAGAIDGAGAILDQKVQLLHLLLHFGRRLKFAQHLRDDVVHVQEHLVVLLLQRQSDDLDPLGDRLLVDFEHRLQPLDALGLVHLLVRDEDARENHSFARLAAEDFAVGNLFVVLVRVDLDVLRDAVRIQVLEDRLFVHFANLSAGLLFHVDVFVLLVVVVVVRHDLAARIADQHPALLIERRVRAGVLVGLIPAVVVLDVRDMLLK